MHKILHLDRNGNTKRKVKKILRDSEIKLFEVNHSQKAFEILDSNEIDLVLLGTLLEDSSREKFISNYMTIGYGNVPLVVINGNESSEKKQEYYKKGAIPYFLERELDSEILKSYIEQLAYEGNINRCVTELSIGILSDDVKINQNLSIVFKKNNVSHVEYYAQASEMLNKINAFDIIIMTSDEFDMPREQIILESKRSNKACHILFVAKKADIDQLAGIWSLGGDDYIEYPFTEMSLLVRIKSNVRSMMIKRALHVREQELKERNVLDDLTQIYNRKQVIEELKETVRNAKKSGEELAVFAFQIDGFRLLNEMHGHQIGDEVLVQVIHEVQSMIKEDDILGRYGGQEFLIVMNNVDVNECVVLADEIRVCIESLTIGESKVNVTISGGVAELTMEDAVDLVKIAEDNMRRAKRNGKNRIES